MSIQIKQYDLQINVIFKKDHVCNQKITKRVKWGLKATPVPLGLETLAWTEPEKYNLDEQCLRGREKAPGLLSSAAARPTGQSPTGERATLGFQV